MRVFTTLTYYHPNISGLSLHAQMISEALVQKGYDVTILCMRHKKQLPPQEVINGVKIQRAKPLLRISKGFLSWDYINKCLSLVKNTDVVIIHLPQVEGIFSVLYAKLFGKRVLIFYHCDVILPKGIINKLIEKLLYFSNYLCLKYADTILHSTKDFAEHSRLLQIFHEKIEFTYPPIKDYKAYNRIKKLLIMKTRSKYCYRIGIVARIAADKGFEYLLEAIPLLQKKLKKKFMIFIAGPPEPVGEEDYKKKIIAMMDKYKDHLFFLGMIKEEDMGSLLAILDVLVVPSINSTESFGTVQVEAMMQGTPIVVNDLPGMRIPVRRTGMGLIVPIKNKEKLTEAIVEILNEKNKYKIDINKIKQEFLFANTLKTYEKIIKNA
ncbi:hypothetical protein A3D03_00105 [Candidatus Gottesmanbacteria bacterium RIFCSPHIGHO2_02_FULL_40_13]|uniref:Glycosyl transferase family 1 domain-containing protein n=1 Tax=Candidatus Gottesmanbacteria bacterium RIFCSPHIGHO2_02_FULL_40_13 TaxID=1798384 RepID=A0A1F6A8S5_9BACT|nr:MAG: hypothetical protein A3D03_00105 [Candidatus Gottesmanbacteria bacterium RIFCSPHIGHO2_02_FULL_40_13]